MDPDGTFIWNPGLLNSRYRDKVQSSVYVNMYLESQDPKFNTNLVDQAFFVSFLKKTQKTQGQLKKLKAHFAQKKPYRRLIHISIDKILVSSLVLTYVIRM